jgi:hypothetical protein
MKSSMSMDYKNRFYLRNLYGIGFLLFSFMLILTGEWTSALITLGFFLIIEQIWNFMVFEMYDFLGHEWLGVLLIIISISFMNASFTIVVGLIIAAVAIYFNLEKGKYPLEKIRRIFNGR